MHLKSQGALMARTLSYSSCEFEPIETKMDKEMTSVYDDCTIIWRGVYDDIELQSISFVINFINYFEKNYCTLLKTKKTR